MISLLLGRKIYATVAVVFAFVLGTLFVSQYFKERTKVEQIHANYKEFLYLLENAKGLNTKPLTERKIRDILNSLGLKVKKFTKSGGSFRIVLESLPAGKVILLIDRLERAGGIIDRLELVDNTGKGNFYAVIVVKSST
jgi:hypothetical protein